MFGGCLVGRAGDCSGMCCLVGCSFLVVVAGGGGRCLLSMLGLAVIWLVGLMGLLVWFCLCVDFVWVDCGCLTF